MCIRVQTGPLATLKPWDPERRLITIPQGIPPKSALVAVHAVLAKLGVPPDQAGAVCWCGAAVELPAEQRSSQVMNRAS